MLATDVRLCPVPVVPSPVVWTCSAESFPLQLGNRSSVCSSSSLPAGHLIFLMKLRICSESFWVQSEATHAGRGCVCGYFLIGLESSLSQSLQAFKSFKVDGAKVSCFAAKLEPSSIVPQWVLLSSGAAILNTVVCNGQDNTTHAMLRYVLTSLPSWQEETF